MMISVVVVVLAILFHILNHNLNLPYFKMIIVGEGEFVLFLGHKKFSFTGSLQRDQASFLSLVPLFASPLSTKNGHSLREIYPLTRCLPVNNVNFYINTPYLKQETNHT